MSNSMKGNKINSNALEVIMRDVLHGMAEFTRDSSSGGRLGSLEIVAVESPEPRDETPPKSASILPFPASGKNAGRK